MCPCCHKASRGAARDEQHEHEHDASRCAARHKPGSTGTPFPRGALRRLSGAAVPFPVTKHVLVPDQTQLWLGSTSVIRWQCRCFRLIQFGRENTELHVKIYF